MSAREPPAGIRHPASGIRKVESSNDVEQSTMTALCRRADSTPSAPFSTASTLGSPRDAKNLDLERRGNLRGRRRRPRAEALKLAHRLIARDAVPHEVDADDARSRTAPSGQRAARSGTSIRQP
ncbi:MAG: hypothetical protein J0I61_08325 [Bosea sp.]|nr:hypothetical protein [Bosea sp. (in: a-proteobacteria)]